MMEFIRQPLCMTLMPNAVSAILSLGGTELQDSLRFLDLTDISTMSCQFKAPGVSVQIEGSPDFGATWLPIVPPPDAYIGANPYRTGWYVIPDDLRQDNVLLRAVGIGAGLLVTVSYVEVQYR